MHEEVRKYIVRYCIISNNIVLYGIVRTYSGYDDSSAGHAVSHHVHVAIVAPSHMSSLGKSTTGSEKLAFKWK